MTNEHWFTVAGLLAGVLLGSGLVVLATGLGVVGPLVETGGSSPLPDGATTWFGGRLVDVSETSLTVDADGKVTLSTTHGALFVEEDDAWVPADGWGAAQTGTRLCVAAHWHASSGEWHVVKGFANASCSPTAFG